MTCTRVDAGPAPRKLLCVLFCTNSDRLASCHTRGKTNRLTEESTTKSDTHRLDLCVVGQSVLAEFSANTGLLEATEGHLVGDHVVAVDPHGTGLEGVGDTDGGVEVGGVHGSGETVGGLVTSLDDLFLGLELGDGAHGAEDLFLHDLHVLADTGEDGGLDEVSLLTVSLTTGLELGTRLLAGLDVVHDSVVLELADLGTLEGVGGEWVTDHVLLRSLSEGLDELVVHARLHVDAGSGTAALTVVEKDTEVDPRDGVLDVGVVEHNVGRLATELEGDLLEVGLGRGLENGSADNGGTSEGNLVDVHVRGDGGTSRLAETGEDVDHTSGDPGLLAKSGGVQTRERGLLGGFQDNDVTSGKRRADLPGPHEQGEVPWDDLTTHTDGLVSGVVEGLGVGVDDLAVNLVSPTGVVSQAAGREGHVDLGHGEGLSVVERLDGGQGVDVLIE